MDTGGIFQIVGSNALSFIDNEELNNPQTDTNRLYGDYEYFDQYCIDYAQPIEQGDSPFIQFRMNYSDVTFTLVSESGSETTLTYSFVSSYDNDDYGTISYYNCFIDPSSLSGLYYVKVYAGSDTDKVILNLTSNYFNVGAEFKNTLLLGWFGNYAYNDGFEWDSYSQELRIEALFVDNVSAGNVSTTIDSDNNIELLNFNPSKRKVLKINLIPDYICQLLNRAIGHDLFIINDEVWKIDGVFDFGERHGQSRMYSPTIELQLKDYENNIKIEEKTGTFPIIPVTTIKASEGVSIMASLGVGIKAS